MASLSQNFPHFISKAFLPYEIPAQQMPHIANSSLMSPILGPFVPSNIFNFLQEESKRETISNLLHLQVNSPIRTTKLILSTPESSRRSDTSSISQVTSSTSDADTQGLHRNVIVRNDSLRKKKELVKDDAYWERRRKNNDAAKRSRDSRRQKEDEMAVRAAVLEQENIRLRLELEHLREETDRLRVLVLTPALLSNQQSILSTASSLLQSNQQSFTVVPPLRLNSPQNDQLLLQLPTSTLLRDLI